MKILFDQGTPVPLRRAFTGHTVYTAFEMGWSQLENGAILSAAEVEFDVFITTDKQLRNQQSLKFQRLAILVLPTTSWPKLHPFEKQIVAAVNSLHPGDFVEFELSGGSEV